jgi:L-cysteine desulfidase
VRGAINSCKKNSEKQGIVTAKISHTNMVKTEKKKKKKRKQTPKETKESKEGFNPLFLMVRRMEITTIKGQK